MLPLGSQQMLPGCHQEDTEPRRVCAPSLSWRRVCVCTGISLSLEGSRYHPSRLIPILVSHLLASCFQGSPTAGERRRAMRSGDAGLAEEAKRPAALGDVGCGAAGGGNRVGPCTVGVHHSFPFQLAQPPWRPGSPFWVLGKGIGSLSRPKNPQHRVLLAS